MAKKKLAIVVKGLPAGFKQITGDFAPKWDFKKNPELQGTVFEIKAVAGKRKGKNKRKDSRVMTIADSNGEIHAVWHSAGLNGLFDTAEKGSEVYIRYVGLKKIAGKPQPMKEFVTAMKETAASKKAGK